MTTITPAERTFGPTGHNFPSGDIMTICDRNDAGKWYFDLVDLLTFVA
jgi:hypothetical protein